MSKDDASWVAAEHQAYGLIEAERQRQVKKWGNQSHTDGEWSIILAEEVGEWAKEVFDDRPDEKLEELVQVAAVAVAMLTDEVRKRSG